MTPTPTDSFADFAPDELNRYARHFALPEVGGDGQRRIRRARVLVVGAGGLGSPASLYLAAAGVGRLGIIDADRVELSNLQRQILHGSADVGRPKVESAGDRLGGMNPGVELELYRDRLTSANAMEIIEGYDLVVDGSDNFPTRYLVNDACVLLGRPWVYGAVLRWEGQLALFGAPGGPCYRCLFREPPPPGAVPGCAEAGVMGALTGIIGSMQALEALKWILGAGDSASGRLLRFDGLGLTVREVHPRRDPACPVCGDTPEIRELIDYEWFCATGTTRAAAEGAATDTDGAIESAASAPRAAEESGADAPPAGRSAGSGSVPTQAAGPGAGPGAAGVETPGSDAGGDEGELDPARLGAMMASPNPPGLVDVREDWEWAAGNLEELGARHVPMDRVDDELGESESELVLYCQTGRRSRIAMERLRARGVEVRHLTGGYEAWKRAMEEP